MFRRLCLQLLMCCVALCLPAGADEALYASLFPKADARAEWERSYSPAEQQQIERLSGAKPSPRLLRGVSFYREGQLLGHAIIDDVRGKHRPITFLMATDAGLSVQAVEILAYRESHGGEVRAADWRAQFRNKGPGSALVPGKDIVNIAGATISCRNLTIGVRQRLAAMSIGIGSGTPVRIVGGTHATATNAAAPKNAAPAGLPRSRLLMGTLLSVQIDHPDAALRERAEEAVFAEVARIDLLLSDWRADSALSVWQDEARERRAVMPEELALVTEECLTLHERTQAAFDVGLGALTSLYRDGRQPSEAERLAALAASGLKNLDYCRETRAARLRQPQLRLDFGGYGKGYALRRAQARLAALGIERALLDFGGQLHALPGSDWSVGLAEPLPARAMSLRGRSLAVSSAAERGAHILDPRNGSPAQGTRASLCIAQDPALADAWSTALFVLGREGLAPAQAMGVAAMLIDAQGGVHANELLTREQPGLLHP
jgi:thiamine biosynthesis lipoprotein